LHEATGDYPSALNVLTRARAYYHAHGLAEDVADCDKVLARVYRARGEIARARDTLSAAQRFYREQGLSTDIVECEREMGHLDLIVGAYDAALAAFESART